MLRMFVVRPSLDLYFIQMKWQWFKSVLFVRILHRIKELSFFDEKCQ